jgi:ankyrin repeat protein
LGSTPLFRAVINSKRGGEIIRILLKAGADRNKKNNYGHSPLEIAQKVDDHKIIEYFEKIDE